MKFSVYLNLLLKKRKVTKAELARQLGLKRQNYIGNILKDMHVPTIQRVFQIAEILKCSLKEKNQLIHSAVIQRGARLLIGESHKKSYLKKTIISLKRISNVKNPSHYSHFKIEPIDFINANEIPYMEGNVIKYICRYPYKGDPINDLIKARTYLNKIIDRETKKGGKDHV